VTEKEDMASICRELLADVRATIKTVRKMMKSKDQDVQVFAVDAFTKLTEMAIALSQAIGQSQTAEGEPNPLSRRARLKSVIPSKRNSEFPDGSKNLHGEG
jgi:hypothetical protein